MIWIGIFIGGAIGMVIMALLQMGKISDLHNQIHGWVEIVYMLIKFLHENELEKLYYKWAKKKKEKEQKAKEKS